MLLSELQKEFEIDAGQLGDYHTLSKTQLANGYCDAEDAEDEILRSAYFSALMLRYWYKILEWREDSKSLRLEDCEFVEWLYDSLRIAFVYRVWRYKFKANISLKDNGKFLGWELDENGNKIPNPYYWETDPNAPDKIINRCCFSTRGREYQYYNKDKRKANVHTYSIDAMVEEDGDYAIQQTGCYSDRIKAVDNIYLLVNHLVGNSEEIEAVIVDGIANFDTYKLEKKEVMEEVYDETTETYQEMVVDKIQAKFDSRSLVKHLNNIDETFMSKFCDYYDIKLENAKPMFAKLKKLNNPKLYKLIAKTIEELKRSPELSSYVRK